MTEPETTQEAFDNLNKELGTLRALTIDRLYDWFWALKYSKVIYVIIGIISIAYVGTSIYLTFN